MTRLQGWPGHRWAALAARLYLGGVFLAACWHKILDPAAFALDVATYQILPAALVHPMAIVLPWLELVAALLLIGGFRTRPASLLCAGMMAMFLAALVVALAKGLHTSCGCFASTGVAEDPIGWKTLVRDGFWLLLCGYVYLFDSRPLGLDSVWPRRGSTARTAT